MERFRFELTEKEFAVLCFMKEQRTIEIVELEQKFDKNDIQALWNYQCIIYAVGQTGPAGPIEDKTKYIITSYGEKYWDYRQKEIRQNQYATIEDLEKFKNEIIEAIKASKINVEFGREESPSVQQMGKKAKEKIQGNKIIVGHTDPELALDELVSQAKKISSDAPLIE